MATMPSENSPISDDNSKKRRANTPPLETHNLFPHGAAPYDDELVEELRRYYDTQRRSPIATGVPVINYFVNGKCIEYYDFFGLGAPDEETAETIPITTGSPIFRRRVDKARRAAAGQQNACSETVGAQVEEGLINNMIVAVVEEEEALVNLNDGMAAGEEGLEEGEFVPDDNVEINRAAEEPGAHGDTWKLRKVLTKSDVNTSSRLLLLSDQVGSHILRYINESEITVNGKQVRVWDEDMQVEHTLRLAKWKSSGSYVFKDGWKAKIVDGRKLKRGDEVGFYWDPVQSRFIFSVLAVAPEPVQAAA